MPSEAALREGCVASRDRPFYSHLHALCVILSLWATPSTWLGTGSCSGSFEHRASQGIREHAEENGWQAVSVVR